MSGVSLGASVKGRTPGSLQHLGAQVERPNECGDEGEQEARQICTKHLPNEASNQSEAGRTKFGVQVG